MKEIPCFSFIDILACMVFGMYYSLIVYIAAFINISLNWTIRHSFWSVAFYDLANIYISLSLNKNVFSKIGFIFLFRREIYPISFCDTYGICSIYLMCYGKISIRTKWFEALDFCIKRRKGIKVRFEIRMWNSYQDVKI